PKLASQDGWCICHSKRATRSDTRKCRSRAYLVGLQHFRQLPNKSKCGLSCQPPDAPPDLQAECQPPKLLSLLKTHGLSRLERMEGDKMQSQETYMYPEPGMEVGRREEQTRQFEDVLSRYLPAFHKRACRFLGNPADAEDAVQDALLSAYK